MIQCTFGIYLGSVGKHDRNTKMRHRLSLDDPFSMLSGESIGIGFSRAGSFSYGSILKAEGLRSGHM